MLGLNDEGHYVLSLSSLIYMSSPILLLLLLLLLLLSLLLLFKLVKDSFILFDITMFY